MNKPERWILPVSVLAVILCATAVFLSIVNFDCTFKLHPHILGLYFGEKWILLETVELSRSAYPNLYVIRNIVFYGLVMTGILTLYVRWLRRPLLYMTSAIANSYRRHRGIYLGSIVAVLLVMLLVKMMLVTEYRLWNDRMSPGNFQPFLDFRPDSLVSTYDFLADELGMTYNNPNLYPRQGRQTEVSVNEQGFPATFAYTKEVIDSLREAGKEIIFIIGDSFTFGTTSTTHDRTFVEILRASHPEAAILSFGVRGTDVVQYRLVAERFIPELRPDKVLIAFCGDNDIMDFERTPRPFLPYLSDGMLLYVPASISGVPDLSLSPDSAYHYYRERFSLFSRNDPIARILRLSCLTTLLYPKSFDHTPDEIDSIATFRSLFVIKTLSDSVNANFNILFLPSPVTDYFTLSDYHMHYDWVFRELMPNVHFFPPGMIDKDDYLSKDDVHFNDSGNRKTADLIDKILFNKDYR